MHSALELSEPLTSWTAFLWRASRAGRYAVHNLHKRCV
jgi:hypothetical protein